MAYIEYGLICFVKQFFERIPRQSRLREIIWERFGNLHQFYRAELKLWELGTKLHEIFFYFTYLYVQTT